MNASYTAVRVVVCADATAGRWDAVHENGLPRRATRLQTQTASSGRVSSPPQLTQKRHRVIELSVQMAPTWPPASSSCSELDCFGLVRRDASPAAVYSRPMI